MKERILVVDDDQMNLKMAEFILKRDDYRVILAESGMQCLQILRNEPIDLILLDINMPVMNGMKTLEHIRENENLKDIPVMFLTASADSDDVVEASRLGAIGYITKPFLPEDLLQRVKNVF